MRYFAAFLLMVGLVFSLAAQDVDISQIDPQDLDPQLLDVSDASFFFQGPMEIYVEDLVYNGRRYAAVLDYDGGTQVEVKAPRDYGADMRPDAIDMSGVEVMLNEDGSVTLEGAVINGFEYRADLVYQDSATLGVARGYDRLGPAASPAGVTEERMDQLQTELADTQTELERAEQRVEQLRGGNEAVADLQDEIETLESRVAQRNSRVESLQSRVSELREQLDEARNPSIPRLPRLAHSGFSGRSTSFGSWSMSGGNMEQSNANARFAKAVYPVTQSGSGFTYALTASTPDDGWVGYGVHFLGNGSSSAQGYGFGESYLLWVTRDPDNQTDRGYVQLYQSFNDVHMIQLASAALPISSFDGLTTTAYANVDEDEIQVFVEGQYAFAFPVENLGDQAGAVALRALGQITFEDFSVRVAP